MWKDRRDRKLPSVILRRRSCAKSIAASGTGSGSQRNSFTKNNIGNNRRVNSQLLTGPRPTFSGAQQWVRRHQRDIDTVVHLLDLYPNLIQTEGFDPLWDFLQPVFRRNSTGVKSEPKEEGGSATTRRKSRGQNRGHHQNRTRRPSHSFPDSPANARYVYVCDTHKPSVHDHRLAKSTKDKVVTALSSYCFVRTSPELPISQTVLAEVLTAVSTAHAFVFLMNDNSLSSWFCLHQLGIAVSYDIPIVAVREAGYSLPPRLPSECEHLGGTKSPADIRASQPLLQKQQHHIRSKSTSITCTDRTPAKSESQSSGFHSDPENLALRQPSEFSYDERAAGLLALSEILRTRFRTSVVYVPHFHDSCIVKLFDRLSVYLGDIFLNDEVSKTDKPQQHRRLRTSQSTDSEVSLSGGRHRDRLPSIKGNSVLRKISRQRNSDSEYSAANERLVSSDDSHEPPDTPTSTTEKSSTAPNSPIAGVKLPPIYATATLVTTPDESQMSPEPSSLKDIQSVVVKATPASYDHQFVSPPSSPFMETRYLVFPSSDYPNSSEKSKPYLVSFPADLFDPSEEDPDMIKPRNYASDKDDTEEHEMELISMQDDPSFDKIKLDVRQDAVNEKSPFSSPLPFAKSSHLVQSPKTTDPEWTPRVEGKRTVKVRRSTGPDRPPPKVAERYGMYRGGNNGMLRGLQLAERNKQSQANLTSRSYLPRARNHQLSTGNSSRWVDGQFGKKNVKMAKVTLQYGPHGKLPNPLI